MNRTAEVSIFEQTYIFPNAVSALSTTSTKFGIATKDFIGMYIRINFALCLSLIGLCVDSCEPQRTDTVLPSPNH